MPLFMIRQNCEYSVEVEAEDEEEALEKVANELPAEEWATSWSSREVDTDMKGK